MSGSQPDDRAGLYVLGALNAEEMRAIREAAERDLELAAEIKRWERRLAPLTDLVPPVTPPDSVWRQLETRLARLSGPASTATEIYVPPQRALKRRSSERRSGPGFWRPLAIASMAAAAMLAVVSYVRPPPPLPRYAMILPARPGEGGWLAAIQPNGSMRLTAQGAIGRGLDHDYELWTMAEGDTRPVARGLLPPTGQARLAPAVLPNKPFTLLVSLEPKGGSPTGLPTGPVLFSSAVLTR